MYVCIMLLMCLMILGGQRMVITEKFHSVFMSLQHHTNKFAIECDQMSAMFS